jgi:hypothetical protein
VLSFGFSFFALIIITTYTANLAAFLTTAAIRTPIGSLDDLRHCGCRFGVRNGTATSQLFRDSPIYIPFLPQLVLFNTTQDGVDALQNKTLESFVGDTPLLDYIAQHPPCDTAVVGAPFATGYYSLALAENMSALTDLISERLLQMQDAGDIDLLYGKWWHGLGTCAVVSAPTTQLGFYNLRGLFAVLAGFMVVALMVFACELLWHYCVYTPRQSITDPKRCVDRLDVFLGGTGAKEI